MCVTVTPSRVSTACLISISQDTQCMPWICISFLLFWICIFSVLFCLVCCILCCVIFCSCLFVVYQVKTPTEERKMAAIPRWMIIIDQNDAKELKQFKFDGKEKKVLFSPFFFPFQRINVCLMNVCLPFI